MSIQFAKYNATGNDFIVLNNLDLKLDSSSKSFWKKMCSLKTGVGADGILFLEKSQEKDFKMRYLNADGGEVEMCGNGARTLTAFYHELCLGKKIKYAFETAKGIYECEINPEYGYKLKMNEPCDLDKVDLGDFGEKFSSTRSFYLNTGVPHAVLEVKNILDYPVLRNGKKIREDSRFINGCNANFFEVLSKGHLRVRTYERGVENETLSCGTGAVATALVAARLYNWKEGITLETLGGKLRVEFSRGFKDVYLLGHVEKIFTGLY